MNEIFNGETTCDLIALAQSGDRPATNRLLERIRPLVRRWLTCQLPTPRDLRDTEDLVQETLIRTTDRLPHLEFSQSAPFFGYLHKTAMSVLITEFRRLKRRPDFSEVVAQDHVDGNDPFQELVGSELLARVYSCMEKMDEKNHGLVAARVVARLDLAEIKDLMGFPTEGAARVAVGRALEKLSLMLARSEKPPLGA